MQSRTPPPQPEPRDSGFALFLKIVLVVSLVALVASVPRLFRKKPPEVQQAAQAEEQAVPELEETPRVEPERRPMVRREATPPRPVSARQPRSAAPTPTQATSNLWASVASPRAESGYWMASRLPELRSGAEGIGLRFEPPVFYRVPLKYGEELSNSLAAIRSETNVLKQFEVEFATLFNGADRDHQDYVRTAKAANAQRRTEAGALLQKLTDMQALYLERKREFQQEHARLKPQPQDSLADLDRKLVILQRTTAAYEKDINQLEAAIFALTKQVQSARETLNTQDEGIEKAYEWSAQDVRGHLNILSNRLHGKLGEVNAAIQEYNAQLGRWGSPLHSP